MAGAGDPPQAPPGATVAREPASLPESLALVLRCWRSIAAWALLGLVLAALVLCAATPSFRARTSVLIERDTPSGLLGDLAMLATLASAPAAASELMVLESRTLAEAVLEPGRADDGSWLPLDPRHLGLDTLVRDEALRPLALLRRALFHPPPPDVPLVLPERELLARIERRAADAPARIRVEFLDSSRLRVTRAGLFERLGLGERAPRELAYRARESFEYQGLSIALEAHGDCRGASFVIEHLPRHEALAALQEKIRAHETALNSGVIEIVLQDSDPRRAARTANALCQNYLDALLERGQRRASKTVDYIQGLLDEQFQRFEEAQDAIVRLQEARPELLAPEGAAGSLIEELATLELERIQLEVSARAFEEIVAGLEAGDARALAWLDDTLQAGVLADPVSSGFLAEIARLEAEYGALGADLLEGHPLVRENRAASAALLARTRDQLASRLTGLRARAAELGARGDELRERMRTMPAGARELAEARIELEVHQELVPYLVRGLQGAEITRSSAETWAEVIDPAAPPTELGSPVPARTLGLGLVLGLALGLGLALWRAPRKARVASAAELAEVSGASIAAGLPRLAPSGQSFLDQAPAGAEAEALRALRSALEVGAGAARVYGVTSLRSGPAAASVAAELALAFALQGRRTLLSELDLRGAQRSATAEPGLAQHLDQARPWRELVRPGRVAKLERLPAGKAARPAADLLGGPTLERFLDEARAAADALVLALPAWEEAPELAALARRCDVVLLVERRRELARERVARAARALHAAGVRQLAAVLVARRGR